VLHGFCRRVLSRWEVLVLDPVSFRYHRIVLWNNEYFFNSSLFADVDCRHLLTGHTALAVVVLASVKCPERELWGEMSRIHTNHCSSITAHHNSPSSSRHELLDPCLTRLVRRQLICEWLQSPPCCVWVRYFALRFGNRADVIAFISRIILSSKKFMWKHYYTFFLH